MFFLVALVLTLIPLEYYIVIILFLYLLSIIFVTYWNRNRKLLDHKKSCSKRLWLGGGWRDEKIYAVTTEQFLEF